MNREIKFRAWDKCNNYMIYPSIGSIPRLNSSAILERFENVMQYTGLKDKNGKEIYEGDILQAEYAGSSQGLYKNQVIWDENEYGFSFANAPLWTWENIEIVGNIYENSKLLES